MSGSATLYVAYTVESLAVTLLSYKLFKVQSVGLIFVCHMNTNW